MKKIDIKTLGQEDAFDLIGKQWMLVTAGTQEKFNMMTASWGGIAWLWNKPVAFIFIRPERYTHEFIEANERVTLSFYPEDCRKALNVCGSKSGRTIDKVAETGLYPEVLESGAITFKEARLTLDCRKLFKSEMQAENFIDKEILSRWYNDQPGGGLHTVYVLEIENIYENKLR
ncbi:MAG: flavin reductase family protein [Bacteroidaceae bacterium]|nr:flavin reductase family protein [Bacteroidaceae bacterium]